MGTYLHRMPSSTPSERSPAALAWSRLREAEYEHDAIRRAFRQAVTTEALLADNRRWEALGAAVASLARAVADHCVASSFCDARPDVAVLAVRICESFDDLTDEPAWTVIDAAARYAALKRP
jgi:hypothetical protein